MKRLWFSAIFILMALSICVFEQAAVYKSCDELLPQIDAAIEETDLEKKAEKCAQIEETWEDFDKKAAYITDHSVLKDAEISISALNELNGADEDKINEALIDVKSEVEQLCSRSKINLSNIL